MSAKRIMLENEFGRPTILMVNDISFIEEVMPEGYCYVQFKQGKGVKVKTTCDRIWDLMDLKGEE